MRVRFVPVPEWACANEDVAGLSARALTRRAFADHPGITIVDDVGSGEGPLLLIDERVWCHDEAITLLVTAAGEGPGGLQVVDHVGRTLVRCRNTDQLTGREDTVRSVADVDPQERFIVLDSTVGLAACERHVLFGRAMAAMSAGVRVRDPYAVYIRGLLRAAAGAEIDIGTIVEGEVVLEAGVRVGPHCLLRDCRIGAGTVVQPYSIVDGAVVGAHCRVGPYGRLRPGAALGERVQIGNFVEVKASQIGDGSRINHHSFIGDATLGPRVTIGAGTITCNHDGTGTQPTIIGADVTVGSGCQLVAPVTIAAAATVGAGSTITEDVTTAGLTLARARQMTIDGWAGPRGRRSPS